jgi:hypothetical protein
VVPGGGTRDLEGAGERARIPEAALQDGVEELLAEGVVECVVGGNAAHAAARCALCARARGPRPAPRDVNDTGSSRFPSRVA